MLASSHVSGLLGWTSFALLGTRQMLARPQNLAFGRPWNDRWRL